MRYIMSTADTAIAVCATTILRLMSIPDGINYFGNGAIAGPPVAGTPTIAERVRHTRDAE